MRPLIEQQIAGLDAAIKTGAVGASAARIRVRISVAPAIATRIRSDAPLFVLARTPGQPGPPLAVKRLGAHFPQDVELSESDSMLAGHSIAAGQTVEVLARVALGGNPTGTPGDLIGVLRYAVGKDGQRELVIDQITP